MHHVKAEMMLFSKMLITLHVQIGTCDSFCYGGSHIYGLLPEIKHYYYY